MSKPLYNPLGFQEAWKHNIHNPQQDTDNMTKNPCQDHKDLQRDMNTILHLYETIQKEGKHRDSKLLYAFQQNTKQLEDLRKDLDERKLINNYNEKEKNWLKDRVDSIGNKTEDADKDLYERTSNLEKAIVVIAKNDENQDKSISKLEKLLYLAIGLIISFFITFGYKTLFLGI